MTFIDSLVLLLTAQVDEIQQFFKELKKLYEFFLAINTDTHWI